MVINQSSNQQFSIIFLNRNQSGNSHEKEDQIIKSKQTCLSWGMLAFCFAMAIARVSPPVASTRPREAASLPVQTLPCATSSILST